MDKTWVAGSAGLADGPDRGGRGAGGEALSQWPEQRQAGDASPRWGLLTPPPAVIKAFAARLENSGQEFKVVITACTRKLLTIANALVKSNTPWTNTLALATP